MPPIEAVPTLVSPRRLGAALHAQRIASGASLTALSRRCDGWWTPDELIEVERGAVALDDASIVSLCRLYALPGRGLAVAADLELVHDRSASAELVDPLGEQHVPDQAPITATLRRYIALLEIVGVEPADGRRWIPVLSEGLGVAETEVAAALAEVHAERSAVDGLHDALADRIAVPAIGLLVDESAHGSLVLVRRAGGSVRAAHEPVPAAGPLRWFDSPVGVGA